MSTQAFLQGLARISAHAGMLVLLVLLAQWLFRQQLTPRWRCALWLLVVVRLVLPFSPGSAASVFNLIPQWSGKISASRGMTVAPAPEVHPATPVAAEPAPQPRAFVSHSVPSAENTVTDAAIPEEKKAPLLSNTTSPAQPPLQISPARPPSLLVTLFWGWLGGAVILAGYVAVSSLRLVWRCRGLSPFSDGPALAMLGECANRLGVRARLTVVEGPEVSGPALFGVFRPRLLLPKGFTQNFSTQELRFVFLHELAHLKRWDLPLNWLVAVLQIVHWFNPLVWFGFSRWRSDRELACDALALEAAGADQHREYGRAILHLLENLAHRAPAPGLVGILEDKRQLRRRIGMIANFRPGQRWGLLSIALLAALALVGLTDAQTPKAQKPVASTSSSIFTNNPAEEVRLGIDPKPETSDTNAELRSLTVLVLDPTGKPLAGAEVHTPYINDWTKPQPKRLTDENGKFTVRFMSVPKQYRREMSNFGVSASHKDYAQRAVMWTSSGGDVYGGMPGEVTIKLGQGISIGGLVQNESGAPLAGVRVLLSGSGYRGFTMGNTERMTHEYSEVWMSDKKSPAATTDSAGRWTFAKFPSDLEKAEVTFVRPDDARESFSTEGGDGLNQRPRISFAELKAQTAVVNLREGLTVRGIAVDEAGKPLSGVTIKEGYGHGNMVRAGEFTTGEDGRFERTHRAPRQWIYTASRPDRATTSFVAQVEPGMAEIRIVMPPAKPLIARAKDENGKALADVEFRIDQYRSEGQLLDWTGNTDASGLVVWSNAPSVPVTFYALSKPLGATRKVKVAGGDPEKLVVLSRDAFQKIKVQIKAMDAQSRQPVKVQNVTARYEGGGSPFIPLSEPDAAEFSVEIRRDAFRVGMYPSYELQLAAAGYEAFTTGFTDFDLGDQDLELALHRSGGADELTVFQPDGQPAAGAKLWVRTAQDAGNLFINAPGRYYGDRLAKEQAGEDGRIKFPGAPGDAPVVISHPNGFLDAKMAELRRMSEVRLRAYGSLEGRLLVAGKPKSGANISLSTRIWSPAMAFHLSYTATTDADGRFVFSQVPAGEFKLYRWSLPKASRGSGRAITETYQMPVTVSAGQTNIVEYASSGRALIGQVMAESADASVNWQNDIHTLSLTLPGVVENSRANREDYATFEAFRKANDASYRSQTQVNQSLQARTYSLEMETDGSFRVEDVPPGTYELRIRVTKPDESQQRNTFGREEELGSLVREIVVPEGKDALDLGTLKVAMKEVAAGKSSPPVELSALTLDGKPFSLAQSKGKNVVLAFWTSWSDRCTEQLAEFQKLQREYGSGALEIVGVSVDNDLKTTRDAVDARSYTWSQAWLDGEHRAKATAAFDVNLLPGIFLIDPEGRVVGRDLEGDRLRAAVRRALQKK